VSVCPLPSHVHSNNTASFSIFIDRETGVEKWHCFGCGLRGDVVDIIGYAKIPGYDPIKAEHIKAAVSLLRAGYEMSPTDHKPQTKKTLPPDLYRMFPLGDKVIEYGKTRGLTADTLEAFGVGQADKNTLVAALERLGENASWVTNRTYMTLPTFHFGALMMIKLRDISARSKGRFIAMPGSAPGLFGFSNIYNKSFPIAIVKGEIPVMVLWQRGIEHVAAPTAGEGMIDEKWKVFVSYATNRIVIGDNDPQKVKDKLAAAYVKRCHVFGAKLHFPPEEHHDVDDWVLSDPRAMDTIRQWLYEGVHL